MMLKSNRIKSNRIKNNVMGYLRNPLIKNSIILSADIIIGALTGFIFWIVAARLYSTSDVGMASAIFSAMALLASLSKLGFDIGLIRYLPDSDNKTEIINTCLTISTIVAIVLSITLISLTFVSMPSFSLLHENVYFLLLFISSVALYSFISVQNSIYISLRVPKLSLFQNSTQTVLKIVFVIVLVNFGLLGLLYSWGMAMAVALIVGIYLCKLTLPNYIFKITASKKIKHILRFSIGNHTSRFLGSAPGLIIPILIINVLNEEITAYFYIAWMIAGILIMINSTVITSFFVECSHDKANKYNNLLKTLSTILVLSIIGILIIFSIGREILLVFNESYSNNALDLLKILSISCIPASINELYIILERMNEKVLNIILVNLFIGSFTIIAGYFAIVKYGLIGIGYSWLIGNTIMCLIILISMSVKKNRTKIWGIE